MNLKIVSGIIGIVLLVTLAFGAATGDLADIQCSLIGSIPYLSNSGWSCTQNINVTNITADNGVFINLTVTNVAYIHNLTVENLTVKNTSLENESHINNLFLGIMKDDTAQAIIPQIEGYRIIDAANAVLPNGDGTTYLRTIDGVYSLKLGTDIAWDGFRFIGPPGSSIYNENIMDWGNSGFPLGNITLKGFITDGTYKVYVDKLNHTGTSFTLPKNITLNNITILENASIINATINKELTMGINGNITWPNTSFATGLLNFQEYRTTYGVSPAYPGEFGIDVYNTTSEVYMSGSAAAQANYIQGFYSPLWTPTFQWYANSIAYAMTNGFNNTVCDGSVHECGLGIINGKLGLGGTADGGGRLKFPAWSIYTPETSPSTSTLTDTLNIQHNPSAGSTTGALRRNRQGGINLYPWSEAGITIQGYGKGTITADTTASYGLNTNVNLTGNLSATANISVGDTFILKPKSSQPTTCTVGDMYSDTSGYVYNCKSANKWNNLGTSGTYTPTLTNVANLDASTSYQAQYSRIGNVVTVSGKVDIDPTLAATSTQLGISLPIASNLGATEDCAGTAFAIAIAGQGAGILGDNTNDRAQLQYLSGDVTNKAMYYTFTYEII